MKLYDIQLRRSSKDQYVYVVEEHVIVSQTRLVDTICEMLSRFPDGDAYVDIKQVECQL